MSHGLYIGRFQPLHIGHLSVITRALTMVEKLNVVIGSIQNSFTWHDPFTTEERIEMITSQLDFQGYKDKVNIITLPDIDDPFTWPEYILFNLPDKELVDTIFSSNLDSVVSLFQKSYPNMNVMIFGRKVDISATKIRVLMGQRNMEWMKYVPSNVKEYIIKINGENRIQNIFDKRKRED